jgi:hypothetical protein
MSANNVILFNAAVTGYVGGSVRGRPLMGGNPIGPIVNSGTPPAIGTPDPSFAAITAGASVFASALDAAIAAAGFSAGAGLHDGATGAATGYPSGTIGTAGALGATPQQAANPGFTSVEDITGTTGGIQFAQFAKSRLLSALSRSAFDGRYYAQGVEIEGALSGPPTVAEYASLASSITTLYAQAANNVKTGLTGTNNLLLWYGCFAGALSSFSGGQGGYDPTYQPTVQAFAALTSLAAAVDAGLGISYDSTISQAGGTAGVAAYPLAPVASHGAASNAQSIVEQTQLAKMRLMEAITAGYLQGRSTVSLYTQFTASEPSGASWAAANAPVIAKVYNTISGLTQMSAAGATATMYNNPQFYNEAYCAFITAQLAGRDLFSVYNSGASGASQVAAYVTMIANAAQAFATEVDLTTGGGAVNPGATGADIVSGPIPTGATTTSYTTGFTAGSGVTGDAVIAPAGASAGGTFAIGQQWVLAKTDLMYGVCRGVMWGRPLLGSTLDTTASTYLPAAESINALFLEAITAITQS